MKSKDKIRKFESLLFCFASALLLIPILMGAPIALGSPVGEQIRYTKATNLAPDEYTFRFSLWDSADNTDEAGRVWWEEKDITLPASKEIKTNLGGITNPAKRSGLLGDVDFSEQNWVMTEVWDHAAGQ